MHFQFLIEDKSGQTLIEQIMKKMQAEHEGITCNYKAFHGIGGFIKKPTASEIKTGKLLNDLGIYISGFDKSLKGYDAALFIVLDNDKHDAEEFSAELQKIARVRKISLDYVFCLAIEEMEAWLLGETNAIIKAYPKAKNMVLKSYVQDSICDTWEVLADAIYPGGRKQLKKDNPSYVGVGKIKCEWAQNIGEYMNIRENKSPSFNSFIKEIEKRV